MSNFARALDLLDTPMTLATFGTLVRFTLLSLATSALTAPEAAAQMELRTWHAYKSAVSPKGGDDGFIQGALEVGQAITFDRGCGYEYLRGALTRSNGSILLEANAAAAYAQLSLTLHLSAGVEGARLRITQTGFDVSVQQPAEKDGSYLLDSEGALDASIELDAGGDLMIEVLDGEVVGVFADGAWSAEWNEGHHSRTCDTILCEPEFDDIPYPACLDSGGLIVSGSADSFHIYGQGPDWAGAHVHGTFELLVPCCVHCSMDAGSYCDGVNVGFSLPSYRPSHDCPMDYVGYVNLQPGVYSFFAGGWDLGSGKLTLQFSAEDCSEDCDSEDGLDINQLAWGWQTAWEDTDDDGQFDCCQRRRGDFNLDGVVSASDLALLFASWETEHFFKSEFASCDPSQNDWIDAEDLAIVLQNWGPLD